MCSYMYSSEYLGSVLAQSIATLSGRMGRGVPGPSPEGTPCSMPIRPKLPAVPVPVSREVANALCSCICGSAYLVPTLAPSVAALVRRFGGRGPGAKL